jgi:hypothetical protein
MEKGRVGFTYAILLREGGFPTAADHAAVVVTCSNICSGESDGQSDLVRRFRDPFMATESQKDALTVRAAF